MRTIRAKLATIILALTTAGALAALSPAGPAVADTSPPCKSPNWVQTLYSNDGRTQDVCVAPRCEVIASIWDERGVVYVIWRCKRGSAGQDTALKAVS